MGKVTAIVLSAGKGSRMHSGIHKQYMTLLGEPLICHTLRAFEESPVNDIVLVCAEGEEDFCRKEIVEAKGFDKVSRIVCGGKERYDSVYAGLQACTDTEIVLIHDGARPCITADTITAAAAGAAEYGACVIAVPVKDTIKEADAENYGVYTPDRRKLWQVQTPQAFSYPLIREAYDSLFEEPEKKSGITDDAMVLEIMKGQKCRLIPGSYRNIKVTTPEDLDIAELFLKKLKKTIDR